ncbi:MAG: acylphosphatase [Gemmatimonadetes bacterium]|nr:acylphosphatase [Gemmatimonadota bacterium]
MSGEDEAFRWLVSGRVQGVGFRWFVIRRAQEIRVGGWVTNLPDGRVEVVARGSPSQLEAFEAALRQGPRAARVETVEKLNVPHQGVPRNSFGVR